MSRLLRSTSAALAGCCLSVAALLACGGSPRPLPAPVAAAPSALPLPAGAALTVRVDLASLRDELGATLARQLLLDSVGAPESAAPSGTLLEQALDRAGVLWVALPAAGPLEEAERILLMRGHFSSLSVDGLGGWQPGPAGFESLDVANTEASGYARVYRLDNAELLVWAPRAELATVERTLARRRRPAANDEPRLEPPERGAVSIAARPGRFWPCMRGVIPSSSNAFEVCRSSRLSPSRPRAPGERICSSTSAVRNKPPGRARCWSV